MDDPTMPDLSHLSAEEREIIENVLKRQRDEEAKETQISQLVWAQSNGDPVMRQAFTSQHHSSQNKDLIGFPIILGGFQSDIYPIASIYRQMNLSHVLMTKYLYIYIYIFNSFKRDQFEITLLFNFFYSYCKLP